MYTSAINGIAGTSPDNMADDMTPLFESLVENVKSPNVDLEGPLQMQISALDYSSYVGVIGVGRIKRGSIKVGQQIKVVASDAARYDASISYLSTCNELYGR